MAIKSYQQLPEEVLAQYQTSTVQGLTENQVRERRAQYGPNKFPEIPRDSYLKVFIRQFQNPLIYVLLAAAAIILFVGQALDAFIISGVLLFNAVVGTVQEGRTENILESLSRFIKSESTVIRDGVQRIVDDTDLVPGDIIVIQEGARVPADIRLISEHDLRVDESILTGESIGVHKESSALKGDDRALAEQHNMLFQGTYVLAGLGVGVVVATGTTTEIGKLHKVIEQIETETPLSRELTTISHWTLLFIIAICFLLLIVGLAVGKSFTELLVMLTALFICVIPEGLPVVLTLVLVSGAYRMAKHNVLVKRLQAVEGLGRIDTLMIDKTGTLTRNEMVVSEVYAHDTYYQVSGQGYFPKGSVTHNDQTVGVPMRDSDLWYMSVACSLLNRAHIDYETATACFKIKGEPTEAALYVFSQKLGFERTALEAEYTLLYEVPFTSETRYHAGLYRVVSTDRIIALVLGAPEIILTLATKQTPTANEQLEKLLANGLRVVAAAYKELDNNLVNQALKQEDVFHACVQIINEVRVLGFLGIHDSIRDQAAQSIRLAHQAGIEVLMLTGDHKETAEHVARTVGLTGTVFSRVSPHDKFDIVRRYHDQGRSVAMTGDGVNDAPSLAAADVGIAMGGIGTEVAKRAADVVLLDDSIANIVYAIEQGRYIFYALKRVVLYFFATNFGEVLVVLFALCLGMPLPIQAAQILWLNLITDGFLDIALAMEPQEPDVMTANHHRGTKRLIDMQLLVRVVYMAVPMGIGSIILFAYYYPVSLAKAQTMTMLTMAMFQWFNAWNCRSMEHSVFSIGFFNNRWLNRATLLVLCLQFLVVYNPVMQKIFKTVPISPVEWVLVMSVASSIFWIEEIRKRLR